MRPSSLADAPGLERTRPLTTISLDVALYGTVALCATEWLARPEDRQDHVAVERTAVPAEIEARDGDVARQLPMEPGQLRWLVSARRVGRPVVVDHRARDRQQVVAGLEHLDQARLAGPVDDRARGHLPEPAPIAAGIDPRPDRVGMDVAVEPQHHVARSVHHLEQLVRIDVSRPAGSALVAERVERVMRGDHHRPVARLVQAALEPPHLVLVDAAIGAARGAHGVEDDEPRPWRVVDVVRRAVLAIAVREPAGLPCAAVAEMRLDELGPRERPAPGVWRDRQVGAGHEGLGPAHEGLANRG